nr:hypothetical protein [Tanacetum cinerariifolium]
MFGLCSILSSLSVSSKSMSKWSLDELVYGAPSECPYQTNLPSPDDIISYIREDREDREGQVTHIRHQEEVEVQDYQILTHETVSTLKPLEEIIRENVFCLGGNQDHIPVCLCYMLYCVANSEKFNLAYFMAKRMEWVTKQARLILHYGMLLTRLFNFIIDENPELQNKSYALYDRVMNPLAAQLERKPIRDRGMTRGRHFTSSSTYNQPSSSHLNDDDDGNNEGTSRASTPCPIQHVNLLTNEVPQVFQNSPNIDPHLEPFYTHQTEIINRQVQIQDEHRGGLRPLNPQLLQSHPSLDITLSLSPITPLDHIHDTSSLPSSPQPQPPIMGHPFYYNYNDYHGSNCICFFHNQTLFLSLRDEMNIMFAHLEYLLTTAITSHFPPPS